MKLSYKPTKAKFYFENEDGVKYYWVGEVVTKNPEHWIEQNKAHNERVKRERENRKQLKQILGW